MYRITASKTLAGRVRLLVVRADTTAEALELLTALRADGWACHTGKAGTS